MIPIQVSMTVSQSNQQFRMTVSQDESVEMEVAAAPAPPSYNGPYSVTPSEEQQTLETEGKKMLQDVSINAVPAASFADASLSLNPVLSVNYDTGEISASNSLASVHHHVISEGLAKTTDTVQISVNGNVNTQLYTLDATTYTPSNVAQTIPAQRYLTGDQTISPVAPPYYDMSGALAFLGAGAELVDTFTLADVKLSATGFNTWTPSTTAADILATRNAGTFTATDTPNWNYFIVWETKIPIVYASAGTNKAKPLFLASIIINALFRRPSTYDNIMASNYNNTVNATAYTGNFLRYYGTTTNSMTYTYNASYGLFGVATAATFSSATADSPTVTAKTPKIQARCSTTYMSTANAGYIDKDKTIISQKGYVYKAKRSTFLQGCYEREIAFVNEVDA